jgi:hypothetical protein
VAASRRNAACVQDVEKVVATEIKDYLVSVASIRRGPNCRSVRIRGSVCRQIHRLIRAGLPAVLAAQLYVNDPRRNWRIVRDECEAPVARGDRLETSTTKPTSRAHRFGARLPATNHGPRPVHSNGIEQRHNVNVVHAVRVLLEPQPGHTRHHERLHVEPVKRIHRAPLPCDASPALWRDVRTEHVELAYICGESFRT